MLMESVKLSESVEEVASIRNIVGTWCMDEPIVLDPKYVGIEGGARAYKGIAPTLTSRDYKDPLRVMMYETR